MNCETGSHDVCGRGRGIRNHRTDSRHEVTPYLYCISQNSSRFWLKNAVTTYSSSPRGVLRSCWEESCIRTAHRDWGEAKHEEEG